MTTQSRAPRAYRGRSLAERRERRRAQLIDAGIVVFGRHGFSGATVKAICAEARLTERYFYESFANSERLFAAVYRCLVERLQADIVAAVSRGLADAEAMARAGLTVFFQTMHRQPGTARILLIEIFGISADIDRLYRSATRDFIRLLRDMVASMFPLERDNDPDRDMLTTGLVGSTIHIAMYWVLDDYRSPIETVVESSLVFYASITRQLRASY